MLEVINKTFINRRKPPMIHPRNWSSIENVALFFGCFQAIFLREVRNILWFMTRQNIVDSCDLFSIERVLVVDGKSTIMQELAICLSAPASNYMAGAPLKGRGNSWLVLFLFFENLLIHFFWNTFFPDIFESSTFYFISWHVLDS